MPRGALDRGPARARTVVRELDLDLDTLFYDTTNFFTYIASTNTKSKLAQRGKSKQKRSDLRLFGLALLVSRDRQIPLCSQVYEGNQVDARLFPHALSRIRQRLAELSVDLEQLTVVYDKGNLSKANQALVDEGPRIVELDYVLGWVLWRIAGSEYLSGRLVFKGGTCLRKCYFPDYRFSEDLDFTATEWFGWEELEEAVDQAFSTAAELSGIDFAAQEPRMRIIQEEYGWETLRLTHYWRGPHTTTGSPPGIRLDITRDEVLEFEPVLRSVFHPFSDSKTLAPLRIRC